MNKPRANLLLYFLLFGLIFFLCAGLFTPSSKSEIDYSTVRELFQEEKVRSFTVEDGVLTLVLREKDKNGAQTYGHALADEEMFRKKHDAVLEDVYGKVKTITAHSREVLAVLHKRYPMVLVSNFYGNIATVLKEFGLDVFFKSIVESAEVGIRKPNPRIFSIGVERLGLKPEEVVVVGDSFYKDIEPALAAGCHAIWMKGEGWTKKEYDESIPDKVITDLEELINVE